MPRLYRKILVFARSEESGSSWLSLPRQREVWGGEEGGQVSNGLV